MMPYLEKFQADTHCYHSVNYALRDSDEEVCQTVLLKKAKLNVMEPSIYVATSEIEIGFTATATLIQSLREKKVHQLQVYELRKECVAVIATVVIKI